jgi:hypothetical protein
MSQHRANIRPKGGSTGVNIALRFTLLSIAVWLAVFLTPAHAAPLSSAKVTETKNVVQYKPTTAEERAAQLGDVLKGTDVLRTGERSLAELEFDDKTITRLGSKSVFTFEPTNREFRLDKGLALICMPKGSGGGRIVTSAITAAIEGTTVIVLGIGKIIFLEGFGTVTTADGKQSKPIKGGQIAFIENGVLVVYDIMLADLLKSGIITSRATFLPTWDAILEIDRQQRDDLAGSKKVVRGAPGAAGQPDVIDPAYRDEGIFGNVLDRPRQPGQGTQ